MRIILILLMISIFLNAQPPGRFYTKFGGAGIDIGYGVKQTLEGNYIIVGSTTSFGFGNSDVYLTKLDSMGQLIWSRTYGGFLNDVGKAVIQLSDSSFVIAGFSNSFGSAGYNALLIRTDKLGNQIWLKSFGGDDWDFANDLIQASDGNIFVCGNTASFGNGNKDGFIIKYDIDGNLLTQKIIGGTQDDELRSIIKTNDNKLASVGYTKSKGEINGDCYFLKLDLNADTLFTRTYGGTGIDYANDLVQKNNNDFVIVGAKTFTNSYTESVIYSLKSNGSFTWENRYYNSINLNEEFTSNCNILYDPNLDVSLRNRPVLGFGLQVSTDLSQLGGWYYKITENGGFADEFSYNIEATRDGGLISVGYTTSFGAIDKDVYLLKQDSNLINNQSIVGIGKSSNQNENLIEFRQDKSDVIINSNEEISNLMVVNTFGNTVFNNKYSETKKIRLDKSNFNEQFYILVVSTATTIYRKKIIFSHN